MAAGFALHMADVCQSVDAVDISAAKHSNCGSKRPSKRLRNVQCIEENIFDYLRKSSSGKEIRHHRPGPSGFRQEQGQPGKLHPGIQGNQQSRDAYIKGWGILITCTCSHHVSEAIFAEMLAEAAQDAGCWARVIERRIQAADHPVLLTVPETLYLKCFILEIRT